MIELEIWQALYIVGMLLVMGDSCWQIDLTRRRLDRGRINLGDGVIIVILCSLFWWGFAIASAITGRRHKHI